MNMNLDMIQRDAAGTEGASAGGDSRATVPIPTPLVETPSEQKSIASEAIQAAKYAVSEYLRDLGMRDPELIAGETNRIVDRALQEFAPGEPVDQALLTDAAIRHTVDQLATLLKTLSADRNQEHAGSSCETLVAANLPGLFAQYPEVLARPNASTETAGAMQRVVPEALPRRMKPQTLQLVPNLYRRFAALFGSTR